MRFYVKRLNPKAITCRWIAEEAENMLLLSYLEELNPETLSFSDLLNIVHNPLVNKIHRIICKAKIHYEEFLRTGKIDNHLLKYVLMLAQIDPIYRAGYIDPKIGKVSKRDIKDLRKLISIVDPKLFKAKNLCILNPTFGKASLLVGGADADILLDDKLIEIKTTKHLKLRRNDYNQLIGYYILSKIGIIALPKPEIKNLGIYFARYGVLYTIPLETVINKKRISSFIKWFKKRAEEERG